ncbi:DUF2461 family protein [Rhodobacteraceae bacterium KMM 6894]|nr:DUF2461 family protein [Rhodobacteraceae bacterium KMM 6894]
MDIRWYPRYRKIPCRLPRGRPSRAGSFLQIHIDVFANAGNPFEDVGYYLHVEPGNCHAGAGLFIPTKAALASLRLRLIDDPKGMREIVQNPEFKEAFPDGIVTRKALKSVPDGFEQNDPAAKYLKMVGLGCRQDLPDALLLEDDVIGQLTDIFRLASPLVRYFE